MLEHTNGTMTDNRDGNVYYVAKLADGKCWSTNPLRLDIGSTTFTIENISLTCGIEIDTLNVLVLGDTVVVKAKYDYTNAQRCICKSRIDFAVDNDEAYTHATLLYFDNGNGSLTPEIMDIVDAE